MHDARRPGSQRERRSFLRLTRELAGLPLDKSSAALETSAAIQVSRYAPALSFATPAAAEVLEAAGCARGATSAGVKLGDAENALLFRGRSRVSQRHSRECSPARFPTLLARIFRLKSQSRLSPNCARQMR